MVRPATDKGYFLAIRAPAQAMDMPLASNSCTAGLVVSNREAIQAFPPEIKATKFPLGEESASLPAAIFRSPPPFALTDHIYSPVLVCNREGSAFLPGPIARVSLCKKQSAAVRSKA